MGEQFCRAGEIVSAKVPDGQVWRGTSGADLLSGEAEADYLIGLDARPDLSTTDLLSDFVITDEADLATNLRSFFNDEMTAGDILQVHGNILNASTTDMAADTLLGGDGNDILESDMGDTMTGGEGSDRFTVYNEVGDAAVTITDFDPAVESLQILSQGPVTALTYVKSSAGLQVLLDGRLVAVLQGVTPDMVRGDWITLRQNFDFVAA